MREWRGRGHAWTLCWRYVQQACRKGLPRLLVVAAPLSVQLYAALKAPHFCSWRSVRRRFAATFPEYRHGDSWPVQWAPEWEALCPFAAARPGQAPLDLVPQYLQVRAKHRPGITPASIKQSLQHMSTTLIWSPVVHACTQQAAHPCFLDLRSGRLWTWGPPVTTALLHYGLTSALVSDGVCACVGGRFTCSGKRWGGRVKIEPYAERAYCTICPG